ncbi:putative DD41D transposase [Trichonephila clavipes]|nr:putative DD41D transposase [Trichonephila clavipes]
MSISRYPALQYLFISESPRRAQHLKKRFLSSSFFQNGPFGLSKISIRTSIEQDRLSDLAILSIETEEQEKLKSSSTKDIIADETVAFFYNSNSCQVIYSQFSLEIHQNDHQARRRFVEWVQNDIAVVPDFHKRILFIDEVHFWLNGYVNKQNCRIWSEANPQVYVETPLHPEKLMFGALYGLVESFFKNDEGHNVTVNGDRYRAMITNFFIPELNNHDVQELWFQQDGATCHTARATIDLLKDTFGERLISRFGPVNWPPRSYDLTPPDYFLWGYVKSLVYADKPQTLDHLEDNIRRVIADIRLQMLKKSSKIEVQIGLH